MKKIAITSALLLCFALAANAQTWLTKLRKESIIDSIVVARDDKGWADYLKMYSYHVYYHQPVTHSDPDGEQFQLRATLIVRQGATTTSKPLQCYIPGYSIHEYDWKNPSYYVGSGSKNNANYEIADHFGANVIEFESRYFGKSCPDRHYERMEYCTAEESAADLHALLQAMKKVFTGKYIISGTSKGGTSAIIQHAFYPDDADLYVPYVAPFSDGISDGRTMAYYKANAWTEELTAAVNNIQRTMLTDPAVYNYVRSWYKPYYPQWSEAKFRQAFLYNVGILDFNEHMNLNREEVAALIAKINEMKPKLTAAGLGDSYLWANMAFYATLDADKCWAWLLPANTRSTDGGYLIPEAPSERITPTPFAVDKDTYDYNYTAYFYQSVCELGSFGFDFRSIFDEKDIKKGETLNEEWSKAEGTVAINHADLRNLPYDGSLRKKVAEATMNASKPIIFLFGGDDAWTGGALPDECYNGINTYKIILPAQNHSACISKADKTDRQYLWALLEDAIAGKLVNSITCIVETDRDAPTYNLNAQRVSVMQKGQIYIKGGKKYFVK